MAPCLCQSVTSQCSIEVVGRIKLGFFCVEASFDQSYTVFQENWVSAKIRVHPSGTFS